VLARRGGEPVVQQRTGVLLWLIAGQATLGYVQYHSGVPELLVGAHILGSVLVLVAAVRVHLSLSVVDPAPGPTDRGADLVPTPVPSPA
jgi:heme a synthase